jgi:two-component system, cell cycle sensor histidine kinase and response regulator CckA
MNDKLSHSGSIGEILFEDSPVGVFTFDHTGRVTRCNRAMVKLLGAPDEKTTQLFNVLTLPTVPERIREDVIRKSLEDGQPRNADFEYVSMHGKRSYLRFHFLPVLADDGKVVEGIVAQAIDMSSVRHATEGLRLDSKRESLSLLAGSLSHDLNNIFTTLLGFTSLLSQPRELSPERTAKALRHTRKAAESGADLVGQLLNFTSERSADASAGSFVQALDQTTTLFSYGLPPAVKLTVRKGIADGVWTRGSITKVEQILLNVLLNARDALGPDEGTISVTASTVPTVAPGATPDSPDSKMGFVRVSITDTGSGISADVLPRIFEPYFTTKAQGHGTGLGLSSVWGLLQELGGAQTVESSVSSGTTFQLYFPVTEPQRESTADRTPHLHDLAGNGERILVVEPDSRLSEMLVWLLLKNGYKVLAAENTEHAFELLDTLGNTVNTIIWDLSVADDGFDQMADRAANAAIPLIQLANTGRLSSSSRELPTVTKPFAPTHLLETLATVLSTNSPTGTVDSGPRP